MITEIEEKSMSNEIGSEATPERLCGNCRRWCPFDQVYEDPLEPDDIGFCYVDVVPGTGPTVRSEDETCPAWSPVSSLPTTQESSN